jgi:3-hydroxybutyryl-CoA dehydrogenase
MTISRAAVVGAGYMGGGIAQVIASAGIPVALADQTEQLSRDARERILLSVLAQEDRGLVVSGTSERMRDLLTAASSIEEAVADANYITEAVLEDVSVKTQTLRRISEAASRSAVIASNTSAIEIETLADSVNDPERFLGVHWMNPAPFIPGVELIPTHHTSTEVLTQVETFIRSLGKIATRVSDTPGFVANRLQFALYREAMLMREEGVATAAQIDEVVRNTFGFRLALFGPFAIGDMAGLDVYAGSYDSLEREYGSRFSAPESLKRLVAQKHLGLKSGSGVFEIPQETAAQLIAYRERAYAALAELKASLGEPPQPAEAGS